MWNWSSGRHHHCLQFWKILTQQPQRLAPGRISTKWLSKNGGMHYLGFPEGSLKNLSCCGDPDTKNPNPILYHASLWFFRESTRNHVGTDSLEMSEDKWVYWAGDHFWFLNICWFGCFQKWGYPKMDGWKWKTLLRWVIWGYHHFRKPPFVGISQLKPVTNSCPSGAKMCCQNALTTFHSSARIQNEEPQCLTWRVGGFRK